MGTVGTIVLYIIGVIVLFYVCLFVGSFIRNIVFKNAASSKYNLLTSLFIGLVVIGLIYAIYMVCSGH